MNILMTSATTSLPANNGARRRIYHTLKEVSDGHEVTFVALVQQPDEWAHISTLEALCEEVYAFDWSAGSETETALRTLLSPLPYRANRFRSPEMRECISNLLAEEDFDVIWLHFLESLSWLPSNILRPRESTILIDFHNDDVSMWLRRARRSRRLSHRLFARLNAGKLRSYRDAHQSDFDVGLAVSHSDLEATKGWVSSEVAVWLAPNGVDLDYFSGHQRQCGRPLILFCGALDIEMNVEAVHGFVTEVFPGIRAAIPETEFWIVGRDPKACVRALAEDDGISVFGSVPDVRPYYGKASVAISPYKLGGGTKLKVLEAMAMRVPMVATSVGCQGIAIEPGKHLLVADDSDQFAHHVVSLLSSAHRRTVLSCNARQLVEERYGWEAIVGGVLSKLNALACHQAD